MIKRILFSIFYFGLDTVAKLIKLISGNYGYYSFTMNQIVIAPTKVQIRAAWRELRPKNIKYLRQIFASLCLKSGDKYLILDIGGNIGYTSLSMYKAFGSSNIEIATFEPYQPNHKFIKKNIRNKNIKLHYFGLGVEERTLDMNFPNYVSEISDVDNRLNTGRVSFFGFGNEGNKDSQKSATLKIGDQIVPSIAKGNKIPYIKIDVEGYELNVLLGLRQTIVENRPTIQLECNPVTMEIGGITMSMIVNFADSVGYGLFIRENDKFLAISETKKQYPVSIFELFLRPVIRV